MGADSARLITVKHLGILAIEWGDTTAIRGLVLTA